MRSAFIIGLVLLATGCSSGGRSGEPTAPAPTPVADQAVPSAASTTVSESATTTTTLLQLETYAAPSGYDAERERQALDVLIVGCAADHGIEYDPPVAPAGETDAVNAILLAPLTLEEVSRYGYAYRVHRFDEVDALIVAAVGTEANVETLLSGTGCGEFASQRVGLFARNQALQEFAYAAAEIRANAESEPAFAAAIELWTACMSAAGYDVASPDDAIAMADTIDGGMEGPAAVELAVADFLCKGESGYRDARDQTIAALSQQWLDQHPEAVARLDDAQAHLNAQVASIIGS